MAKNPCNIIQIIWWKAGNCLNVEFTWIKCIQVVYLIKDKCTYNFCQQITIFNGAIFETSGLIHFYLVKTSENHGYKIKFGKILY